MANELISCDDHLDLGQLPADLWTTRLPAALRDRAPHIEERDGQPVWICDGKVWGSWAGKRLSNEQRRGQSRSTTRSTAAASTTRANAGRRTPNCALPTWTATGSKRR